MLPLCYPLLLAFPLDSGCVYFRLPHASAEGVLACALIAGLRVPMARSKSRKKFTAAKEARRRARELAGTPPAARVIPDKRRKPPKHKKELIEQELF